MNRINKLFKDKKDKILSIYFTAGYPNLNDTTEIIKTLDECGVDLIEIGMPFSDPIADGPVIQDSSNVAIDNGMNLNLLFKQLEEIRNITDIPIVLMGYVNPVYQFGYEKFIKNILECDLDGLILPDLPLDDYINEFKPIFVLGFIKFNSIIFFEDFSKEKLFFLENSFICFNVLSPMDLLGLFTILSKARSSFS